MNKTHDKLLSNLRKLIPCIKGKWFMGDGALLGLVREKKMIEYDDDIDLFLYPNSYIDKSMLKEQGLDYYDYYMGGKIFNPNDEDIIIKNKWLEFLDYVRTLPECEGYNRPQLTSYAKSIYSYDYKSPLYKKPWIDICYLEKHEDYFIYPFNFGFQQYINYNKYNYKTKKELFYDIEVYIPENEIEVLKNIYGKNWVIPQFNKRRPLVIPQIE